MCCWSKTNSVLRVSRRIILQRSRAVNTPRGPEGPAGRLQPRGVTSPHLFVVKSRFLSGRKKGGWHSRQPLGLRAAFSSALSFVSRAGAAQTCRQISEGWDNGVELWGLQKGRAGLVGWPAGRAEVHECTVFRGTPPAYQARRGFLPGFLQRGV